MNLANFLPATENAAFAGDEACSKQHLENSSGQGCPANACRAEREFSRSEKFLVGEFRAVLREHASAGPANTAFSTSEKTNRFINL